MADTAASLPLPSSSTPARIELVHLGEQRLVMLNGHPIGQYRQDDRGTERVLMTQLAEAMTMKDADIALAFGVHPVTLSRYLSQARSGGAAALMPARSGPRRPHKLTDEMQARIVRLHEDEGLSSRTIAERLSRGRRAISHVSVATVLRRHRDETRVIVPLPLESPAQEPAEEPTVKSEPLPVGESRPSRYAGAMMLYAALAQLDLWKVFQSLGAHVGAARRFGWAQSVAALIFCFALRFRSIEDTKNALHEELGVLIGEERSPGVQSLRWKLRQLAESIEPVVLTRELFRRYLSLESVWEGLYYLDGHFCPYYGQHATPRGWDAHRRLAVKGHTDVYVHDAGGRALFFLSCPLNDSLARAIPPLVEEIRKVHGEGPFTLVFDRGGYSGSGFRWLNEHGVGFITYLKGRKARRRYPRERFGKYWFEFEDQRHVYRLYEKATRVRDAGSVRTIVWIDEGEQIPVITNLETSVKPARVVHCLRLRWRQENSFKYLKENYAIDQIIQYGANEESEDRLAPNPKRAALQQRVRELREQIQALEAELGRAVEGNDERRRRTVRGVKIAHGKLRRHLAGQRQMLGRLENRLRHTPSQLPQSELGRARRALPQEDRRIVLNTLKLVAYNAERMLAFKFNEHYRQSKDVLSVFRGLLTLPGTAHRLSADRIEVALQRPQPEKVAAALQSFLEDLNRQQPRLLGDGPILEFALGS